MIHVLRVVSTVSLNRNEHFKLLFKSLGNSQLVWAVTQEWWGKMLIIHHHMHAQSCTGTFFGTIFQYLLWMQIGASLLLLITSLAPSFTLVSSSCCHQEYAPLFLSCSTRHSWGTHISIWGPLHVAPFSSSPTAIQFMLLPELKIKQSLLLSNLTVIRKVCQMPVFCLTNTRPLPRRLLFQYTTY